MKKPPVSKTFTIHRPALSKAWNYDMTWDEDARVEMTPCCPRKRPCGRGFHKATRRKSREYVNPRDVAILGGDPSL